MLASNRVHVRMLASNRVPVRMLASKRVPVRMLASNRVHVCLHPAKGNLNMCPEEGRDRDLQSKCVQEGGSRLFAHIWTADCNRVRPVALAICAHAHQSLAAFAPHLTCHIQSLIASYRCEVPKRLLTSSSSLHGHPAAPSSPKKSTKAPSVALVRHK
eukprot:353822-Chlamydomonas_euryale.AAC.15